MLEISIQPNTLFLFVDEAAVTYLPHAINGRALIGVVPIVEGNLSCRKLSILSCVIPGFGVISRWFSRNITGKDYAIFVREVSDLVRRAICNGSSKLCLIHDNCNIHRTEDVQKAISECKLNEIPTVPYSPQLNEVVEAYFGFQKKEMANYITTTVIYDDELETSIKERWARTEQKFTPKISERYYAKWLNILEDCKNGIPLSSRSMECTDQYLNNLRNNVLTYRK